MSFFFVQSPELTYLSDDGGARRVIHPAMLTRAQRQEAPVVSQAGQRVHAAKGALVPVHLILHALLEESLVRSTQAGHCVVELLGQTPATSLAQFGHPGVPASVVGDEAQEDNAHIDRGEGSREQS